MDIHEPDDEFEGVRVEEMKSASRLLQERGYVSIVETSNTFAVLLKESGILWLWEATSPKAYKEQTRALRSELRARMVDQRKQMVRAADLQAAVGTPVALTHAYVSSLAASGLVEYNDEVHPLGEGASNTARRRVCARPLP